jgi:hypothetical protein
MLGPGNGVAVGLGGTGVGVGKVVAVGWAEATPLDALLALEHPASRIAVTTKGTAKMAR